MKMVMEEIYASLRFTGSGVLPSEITKYLDLLPTRAWQKGDCFVDATGKLRHRYNGLWLYDNKGLTFKRPVGHIRHTMNLIKNRLAGWRDNHDNVRVDLCLWIVASERIWTIYGKDIDLMVKQGYDGFNISFIGMEDHQSTMQRQDDCHAMPRLRLQASGHGCAGCSILQNGISAEDIDTALSLFSRKLKKRKIDTKMTALSCISIEWCVGHGSLYLSCDDLKLFRDIGCSRVDFAFKNV